MEEERGRRGTEMEGERERRQEVEVDGEEGRGTWRSESCRGSSLNPRAQVDSEAGGGRVCRAVQLEGRGEMHPQPSSLV